MIFKIDDRPQHITFAGTPCLAWVVRTLEPNSKQIAKFYEGKPDRLLNEGIGQAMAGDYCACLNDKYLDKNINEEWPIINREIRIKYHREQLSLLLGQKSVYWSPHGNYVI